MKITILYGTETGNAEMLAEDIQSEIEADHEVDLSNLEDFAPGDFDPECFYLLVCSTYGDGDLPASAQPFAAIHFAIFGLGDSEYDETFNHGPKKLAELMIAHGAQQVGERVAHDASGSDMAEDLAFPWAEAVIADVSEKLGEAA